MIRTHGSLAALLVVLALAGCGGSPSSTVEDNVDTNSRSNSFQVDFDLENGAIPFPNDLLFAGSQDGTLNIPTDPSAADFSVISALNALDGFSTLAPITTGFSSTIDDSTLVGGDTVRVFEVVLSGVGGAVTQVVGELSPGVDYIVSVSSVDVGGGTLAITPLRPLQPQTSYLVVLTDGIRDSSGVAASPALTYLITKRTSPLVDEQGMSQLSALTDEEAADLEQVRQLVNAAEAAVTQFDSTLSGSQIVQSWSFTTQSVGDVLAVVRDGVDAGEVPAASLTDSGVDSPLGGADVYVGTIGLAYYLSAPTAEDPAAPLTSHWQGAAGSPLTRFNPVPESTGDVTIPLLATIPKGAKPDGGWPVVIYQHGITTHRGTLLAIADSLAAAGYAAVAIDLPLHGITGDETDGSAALRIAGLERTFDLDVVDNATGAPGADGVIDSSGTHFINLTSLLSGRDNLRQAVADLLGLTKALEQLDYDGLDDTVTDFDLTNIRFVGHSLGAIVGAVYLTLEDSVGAASLAMPGGGIAKLLDGSATFGPQIASGLAANGIIKGTPDYEAFMASAQTTIDAADPLNYLDEIGEGRGIHLIDIAGGNSSLPDQVVPNNVLNVSGTVPSPTAGTDPLATLMGLAVAVSDLNGGNLQAWVRFNAGHHGSLLSPNDSENNVDALSAQVTVEIQSQIATFMATNGAVLDITDSSLVAP